MRRMSGWRFLLVIALPLVLASLGAIGLAYDLLNRVQSSGNQAEHERNKLVIGKALQAEEMELARLASQNARWKDAAERTANTPDAKWFATTWGNTISVGSSYDIVAVIDSSNGKVLLHNATGKSDILFAGALLGRDFPEIKDQLPSAAEGAGLATGYANTTLGPAIVAVAPIADPGTASNPGTGQSGIDAAVFNGRLLVFARLLDEKFLKSVEKKLLIKGIALGTDLSAESNQIVFTDLAGKPALALTWQDRDLGAILTQSSWHKASAVLGFLVVVMTGIGLVCWRLIQQLLANEDLANHNALHDHLTGLPNRLALVRMIHGLAQAPNSQYVLAFADLDGFKEVNDSYGHEIGDRLICMVGGGLRKLSENAGLCCRMGGDEFIVLFEGATALQQAQTFAGQLISILAQPFDIDGRMASVGASVGLAEGFKGIDESEILRRADIAMYRAKADGKNRYCIYDESFDSERNENLSIAEELKQIIASGTLGIEFQPVVNARTKQIAGVEALARWPMSSLRRVPADKFITIAESSGLINDLGELILDRACRAAQAWPELRLAVNISAIQLNDPNFVKRALAVLATHGIAPNRVEFEITETSLIHDAEKASTVFKALQQAGIKIALDDFGTGFSSIGYLRRFQFDRIKIDKSIISKVLSNPGELAIVQGTLLVARGLSADVTAEGVEYEDEVNILRLAGCTELQGFYFYKSMDAKAVSALLSKTRLFPTPRTQIVA